MLEFYPRQLWDPGAFLAVRMANDVSLEAADQGSWEIHTQELPKPGGDSSPVLCPQPYSLELTSVTVQTPPSTKEPGKEQTQGPLSHQGHRISAQSKPPGLLLLTPRDRRTKHLEFSRAPASFLPFPCPPFVSSQPLLPFMSPHHHTSLPPTSHLLSSFSFLVILSQLATNLSLHKAAAIFVLGHYVWQCGLTGAARQTITG